MISRWTGVRPSELGARGPTCDLSRLKELEKFKNEEFEIIISSWFLHILKNNCDKRFIVDNVMRILKIGGYFLYIDIWIVNDVKVHLEDNYNCKIVDSWWLPCFCTPTKVLWVQKLG